MQWLQDLHLRRRMRVPEEIYAAALEAQTRAAAGGVPGWRGALQLLQVMQLGALENGSLFRQSGWKEDKRRAF